LLLLQDVAASLSFAVRSLQQADAAEYLMHYDPLTGLAKRSLFCRRLDELLRTRSAPELAPTVTVLDIDHLNNFNDSFGRNFGDLLLQQVAERLRQQAGCDERVGDLGGGTFVLVAPARRAWRWQRCVARPDGLRAILSDRGPERPRFMPLGCGTLPC
jgi:GGDEF domain-containing protein